MLAHLLDLGEGALTVNLVKKILLDDAEGSVPRTQEAWTAVGLPETGSVTVEKLAKAREQLKG